jgi:nucleoside-diphosphate-sugar epimerase
MSAHVVVGATGGTGTALVKELLDRGEKVLAVSRRGDVRVVIARGGELYGPAVESVLGQNLFGRAVLGRRPIWFGNPDRPITPTYIGDFARGLATVAADERAWGQVWHVPHTAPTTGREFVNLLGRKVGRPLKPFAVSPAMTTPLKAVSYVARAGASLLYQFEQPFIVDSSKYLSAYPGEAATSCSDGIDRTVAWYRANRALIRTRLLPK